MLQVTNAALKEIKTALEKSKDPMESQFVRLNMGIGWGGPQLRLALDESKGEHDQLIEIDEVKFLIHSRKAPYFQNTKLDFVKNWFGAGEFKILNM